MRVFDLQAHNGSRQEEKTRSKAYRLTRLCIVLEYGETAKACENVCEAEKMISKDQFQLKTIFPKFTMLADIEDCVQFNVAKKCSVGKQLKDETAQLNTTPLF